MNAKGNIISDTIKILESHRRNQGQSYTFIFLFRLNGQFPGKYNLQKLTQNEAENLSQLRITKTFNQ